MTGTVVVDVGNSRIKWGRCTGGRVTDVAVLPAEAPDAWQRQVDLWAVGPAWHWVVTGVHPRSRDALLGWLRQRTFAPHVIETYRQLPLAIRVDTPAQVGIDRLLNAVAANTRRTPGHAAVIVDAGSAVTVDLVDDAGAFRGGAIAPGLRLMARALHDHTALLPAIEVDRVEAPPGMSTAQAIRVGVFQTVLGGIVRLVSTYRRQWPSGMNVFVTGGDGDRLLRGEPELGASWPEMTLEGIWHAVSENSTDG